MASQLSGASRFQVVFGRNTGSRKQRAKREGSLSVGFHTSFLFDSDAKESVMVCKGTGVTPNRIFTQMQAARRGAGWTVGTELTLNGFEVVIEEVMELHLIPYTENVNADDAAGPTERCVASRSASSAAHQSPSFRNSTPAATTTVTANATGAALPMVLQAHSIAPVTDAPPALPQRLAYPEPVSSQTNAAIDGRAFSTIHSSEEGKELCRKRPNSPPSQASSKEAVGAKRTRVEKEEDDAAMTTRKPRTRRSAASLARELRTSYPQYF